MDARTALAEPLFDAAPAKVRLAVERAEDAAAVAALVERAFGPGRYAKVSERVREGNTPRADLSFCAVGAGALVGTVRQWPVMVGEAKRRLPRPDRGGGGVAQARRRRDADRALLHRCGGRRAKPSSC